MMTCRITSFEELVEILCAIKIIGNYTISDQLMGYVNRKEYPDYICKDEYRMLNFGSNRPSTTTIKQITVGKLSLIDEIVKKEDFIK